MMRSLLPVREAGSAAASIPVHPAGGWIGPRYGQAAAWPIRSLFSAALPAVRSCNHHADEADGTAGALLRYVIPGTFEA